VNLCIKRLKPPCYAANLLTNALQFCGGLLLLLVDSRLMVSASVDAAKRLRVAPLVVGLTLVAWGTSAPELALNLISACKGRGDLALGNVVGANICNMALVLGVCALTKPLLVQERLIKVEIWLNVAILGFMAVLGLTGGFAKWEAGLMLGVFGAYSMWTIMAALRKTDRAATPAAANTLSDDPLRDKIPMGWLIAPPGVDGSMTLALAYMGLLALALVPISRTFRRTVSRREGVILLTSYVMFLTISTLLAARQ